MTEPIVERLRNWGYVQRLAWLPAHCDSAEWQHVQYRGLTEGEEETRRAARYIPDRADAEEVERAWCTLRYLRTPDQKLLLYVYVWRSRDERICQRLGISSETINGHYVYLQLAKGRAHRSIQTALDDPLHNRVDSPALDAKN